MVLKVIPYEFLERTHTAVGGRKLGRPTSIEPKLKEGCLAHSWKIYSGPIPALNFKHCSACNEIVWLPPDRVW